VKKKPSIAGGTSLAEFPHQFEHGLAGQDVCLGMQDGTCLLADGFHHLRVAVANIVYGYACHKVQILPSVRVPDSSTQAAHEQYVQTAVGLEYGFRFPFLEVAFICHGKCFRLQMNFGFGL